MHATGEAPTCAVTPSENWVALLGYPSPSLLFRRDGVETLRVALRLLAFLLGRIGEQENLTPRMVSFLRPSSRRTSGLLTPLPRPPSVQRVESNGMPCNQSFQPDRKST